MNKEILNAKHNSVPESIRGELQREFWFPTPVWFVDLLEADKINKRLLKDINQWYKRDTKGIVRSNSLGWHSAVDMHNRTEYNHFTKILFKQVAEVMKNMGLHPDMEPWCDNMWANVNRKYSHNRNHTHPGAIWSGVYYIQAPKDSGRLWFTDARGEAHMILPAFGKKREPWTWREVYYEPIPGRLLIFPAWLMHEVEPNLNDEYKEEDYRGWRYSISFNFNQRRKPGSKWKERKGHDSGGGVFQEDLEDTDG